MGHIKTYFLLVLCVLFWAGNFVVGRYVQEDIEPIELSFIRWLFVFVIILPILIIKYKKIFFTLKENFLILLTLAFLGVTLFNTILYIGLSQTGANNALIINSSVPIMIIILSYFILKQTVSTYQVIGIFLSLFGVIYLILQGDIKNLLLLQFNQGDFWILITSLSWALYSVLFKFKPKDLNGLEFFATIVLLGFILLIPIYLYQGYSLTYEIQLIGNNFFTFLYVSLFASVLSYYFWNYGIEKIGASKTSQFTHLMPVFGTILAYIFLDEVLRYYHIIGMVFIALGIYLSLFYKKTS